MTTREYQEAYDDDSDRVREWPALDTQEPEPEPAPCRCGECIEADAADREREFALEGDPLAMWDEIVKLRTLCGKAADQLERVVAERDAALEYIAGLAATLAVKP